MDNAGLGIMIGASVSVGLSYVTILGAAKEKMMSWSLLLGMKLVIFSISIVELQMTIIMKTLSFILKKELKSFLLIELDYYPVEV